MDIISRLSEGILLDNMRPGQGGGDVLMALEVLASVQRRASFDAGVSKEAVDALRACASDVARGLYEGTGTGAQIRAERAARAATTPDEAQPRDEWNAAGKFAQQAIEDIARKTGT